ncbi:hypothetical protein CHH28_02420 [Bacterioplanes sanyensis]|uniref:Uncharacterized protein n=1 Tax=Bacterioplanes sanyensis TaxID=1249553 RepID=A0A222FGH4_9GAMM|nr:hypothetical protein [Bacterioplanes sanyensis]ASP37594.1 hypothetical protein CHH28_02420 [Bacterioplanes sanyensis]
MRSLLFPVIVSLAACGGSSGGSSSNTDTTADDSGAVVDNGGTPNAGNNAQAIDCSLDKSQGLPQPLPEYPGRPYALNSDGGSSPGGFDPENYFSLASGGLVLGILNSEEGILHPGPQWTIIRDRLTRTIVYSQSSDGEKWTISQTGIDNDGVEYQQRTTQEIEQKTNCDLVMKQFSEANGTLESEYQASVDRSLQLIYNEGQLSSTVETRIESDRSGKTVLESLTSQSDYPISITHWDTNGDMTLLEVCKGVADFTGVDCVAANGG